MCTSNENTHTKADCLCENLAHGGSECSMMYNCCDCGAGEDDLNCGCAYCFTCQACDNCLECDCD
jgi:hypothetical protein